MISCLDGDIAVVAVPLIVELVTDSEPHMEPTPPAVFGTTAGATLLNDPVLPSTLLPPGTVALKLPLGTGAEKLTAGAIFCMTPPALECLTSGTRLLLAAALFGLAAAVAPCVTPPLVRDAKLGTLTKPSFELATIKRTGCVWAFVGRLGASLGFQLLERFGPMVRTFSTDFPAVRCAPCALFTLDITTAWPLFSFVSVAEAVADDAATGI